MHSLVRYKIIIGTVIFFYHRDLVGYNENAEVVRNAP